MNLRYLSIFLLAILLFLPSISAASFRIGNNSFVEEIYSSGDLIKGTFSMNFSNQPNALFTSSLGGNISLLDFLNNSGFISGADFNCVPSSCQKTYATSNNDIIKSLSLNTQNLIGLAIINQKDVEISDLVFNLTSTAEPSCYNQFSLDLFDDGSKDIYNMQYLDQPCFTRNVGCFDSGASNTNLISLGPSPYCEKMKLPASPAYRLGANLTNGTLKKDITMHLYEFDSGEKLGSCLLPSFNYSSQELDCIVNYSSQDQFEALVCISTDGIGYKIRSESEDPICGFEGSDVDQEFQVDYAVYAQPLKYAQFNKQITSNYFKQLNGRDIYSVIQDYLDEVYSNQCKPNCVIPIRLIGSDQTVNISDLTLTYKYAGASGATTSNIFDILPKEVLINSSNLNLKFENLGFRAPNSSGTKTLKISFNGTQIISRSINVTVSFDFSIVPINALIAQSTKFVASSSDLNNITLSSWDFGDGSAKVSVSGNTATHTYAQEGNYTIVVEAQKASSSSKRSFTVFVGDPKTSANLTLNRYGQTLSNLTIKFNSYPEWVRKELDKTLNLSEINSTLYSLSTKFNNAVNSSEYISIVSALSSLSIPTGLQTTDSGSSNAVVGFDSINLDYLEQVTNISIEDRDKLKSYIVNWMDENYDLPITFEVISKVTDSGSTPILTRVDLKIDPKTDLKDASYLIINYPKSSLSFKESYQQDSAGSGTYIPLNGDSKEIEFIVPREISSSSLAMYLIPADLSDFDTSIGPPSPYPWGKIILILIIIILVFFVLYGILQIWYKRHYESYLFKNPDDLYNMINFIYNSRLSGLVDGEIKNKLSKSGWNSEQIAYAFKKIDGKRTGMFEIPIFNLFDNQKTKNEIAKRHPEGIDARFIKRPGEIK